jgi:hypothetical protein
MSNYKLNTVNFKLGINEFPVFCTTNSQIRIQRTQLAYLPTEIQKRFEKHKGFIYYTFDKKEGQGLEEIIVKTSTARGLVKPFIDYYLIEYFKGKGKIVAKNFIDNIEIWDKGKGNQSFDVFDKYSLRIEYGKQDFEFALLMSYEGEASISKTPFSEFNPQALVQKILYKRKILKTSDVDAFEADKSFPVLTNTVKRIQGIAINPNWGENTYKKYFVKISQLYETFLKGVSIENIIHFDNNGFTEVEDSRIHKTKQVSNSLVFNDNRKDFNVLSGINKYGPYKVPDTSKVKFIFIFREEFKDEANKLFTYFTKGYAPSFPGLSQFVGVNFSLDSDHSIRLSSRDIISELELKLSQLNLDKSFQYFALYIAKYGRDDTNEDNKQEYYLIKRRLIEYEILSQFIKAESINSPHLNYYLPNIAIAILAKLKGIPWRLEKDSSTSLVVGIGASRSGDDIYLGNTISFSDEGIFFKFDTYQGVGIENFKNAIESSLKNILKTKGSFSPESLVIHYYKTLNKKEARKIEEVLSSFRLNIPYIVLTINETKSKDYVFFDYEFDQVMPISGTIIELRQKQLYLLSNNSRYSQNQSYGIKKFPFPLKIRINKSNAEYLHHFDIKSLIDQVYKFSRIYWKSINQSSIPVTIEYSKIIADLVAHFPEHELPDNELAHNSLWFL